MPAESIHEQIAAALRTLLAGITGANYHYDLADTNRCRVVRTTALDGVDLDESLDHIILIMPGDETIREKSTGDASSGGGLDATMEVHVLIARKYTPSGENPFVEDTPTRWTVIDRAIRDVLRKLFLEGVTVGPTNTVNVNRESLVIDRAQFATSWALAEMSFFIEYEFMAATP